ncbi:rho GTPase-activating protein 5-like [Prosopis cineraria]|uniref:rho GTPase-activating protein 5-like n=1 Tax=Prosopis cineraria TaxID=364024 RepID=UPI00241098B1|nr:rho GTPase-activating protein 5-like [Prosopis cineraria]
MTEVLHSSSHFSSTSTRSSSSSSSLSRAPLSSLSCATPPGDGIFIIGDQEPPSPSSLAVEGCSTATGCDTEELEERDKRRTEQLSVLTLVVALFRKSLLACKSGRRELCAMEIGRPSNVRHVAHVTFDRFNGFLGLPVEFEPEVSRRPPSASATVFGVSTESMQLSYDSRGNIVPTILLRMQKRLYAQGGLQAEGIFRINAENSQEEYVRDQLNSGAMPQGIDVHCLAGLIKAWFRELPRGILDSLSPERVMQCQIEEECAELVRHLPPTEAALLDWAINLMADVVLHEHINKMNARNIAMVFAPNMTQMADPLTALMYAVQVMNFLKTLVIRTLRERKNLSVDSSPQFHFEPSDENGHHSPLQSCQQDANEESEDAQENFIFRTVQECSPNSPHQSINLTGEESGSLLASSEHLVCDGGLRCKFSPKGNAGKSKTDRPSYPNTRRKPKKATVQQPTIHGKVPVERRGIRNLSRLDSRSERIEAWR